MKLYELHVLDHGLGTMGHGYAVAGGYMRIGGDVVKITDAAGSEHRYLGEHRKYGVVFEIENVSPVTLYARGALLD